MCECSPFRLHVNESKPDTKHAKLDGETLFTANAAKFTTAIFDFDFRTKTKSLSMPFTMTITASRSSKFTFYNHQILSVTSI